MIYKLIFIILLNTLCFGQKNNDFPFVAWGSIPSGMTNYENYSKLAEAGINYSFTVDFKNINEVDQALKFASKNNIKLIVNTPELYKNIDLVVNQLKNKKGFGGFFLADEPNITDFNNLKSRYTKIKNICPNAFVYINLYPNYASVKQLGGVDYNTYLDLFYNQFSLNIYSFDFYPIKNGIVNDNWYDNLEQISALTKSKNAFFWGFVKVGTLSNSENYQPTLADVKLQVYTNLAYGAKGIQYYRFWEVKDIIKNTPFSVEGRENVVYNYIKNINEKVVEFKKIFSNSIVESVIHYNKKSAIICNHSNEFLIQNKNNSFNILVSKFYSNGKLYYMLINKDLNSIVNLKLQAKKKFVILNSMIKCTKGEIIDYQIKEGDMLLLRVEK